MGCEYPINVNKKYYGTVKNLIGVLKKIQNYKPNAPNDNKFELFLILTSSIPKFTKILKSYDALNSRTFDNINVVQNIEKALRDYQFNEEIKILSNFKDCEDLIQKEELNEFIFCDNDFIENFSLNDEYIERKKVKITNSNKQILFKVSLKSLFFSSTDTEGFFRFNKEEDNCHSKVKGESINNMEKSSMNEGDIVEKDSDLI